jgi:hypothetical protein
VGAETRRTPGLAAGCDKPATLQVEQAVEVVRNDADGTGRRRWEPPAPKPSESPAGVDPAGDVGGGEGSPGEADRTPGARASARSELTRGVERGRRAGRSPAVAGDNDGGARRRKTSRTPPETVKVEEGAGKSNDPLRTHRGAHTGTDRRRHGPAHDLLEAHVNPTDASHGPVRASGPRDRGDQVGHREPLKGAHRDHIERRCTHRASARCSACRDQ